MGRTKGSKNKKLTKKLVKGVLPKKVKKQTRAKAVDSIPSETEDTTSTA